jgi:uncharacterized NAD(P)/FAD-binding protein YdhS
MTVISAPEPKPTNEQKPEKVVNVASDILNTQHVLHDTFTKWLNGQQATKRKAREFCRLMHNRAA